MSNTISLRPATAADADAMAAVQNAIFAAGLRAAPVDTARMREIYLDHPGTLTTTVATKDGAVIGFQWLGRAWPKNDYGVTPGWGMIGTHIRPDAGRSGVGRRLFVSSLAAAKLAGLAHIDASIGKDNVAGLAYYKAMGFRPYRETEDRIPHRFDL